jgi:signal transduction histidine kinase
LSFFKRLFKTSGSIQRTVRSVEWAILAAYYLLILLTPYAELVSITPYSDVKNPKILLLLLLTLLSGLSLIFPVDRPQWQRRIYIGAELVLLLSARSAGWSMGLLLYLSILKICLLFDRRETIITTVAIGIGWMVPLRWLIPNNDYVRRYLMNLDNSHLIYYYFGEILEYILINIFVLLIGFLVLAESRGQQQIKLLNKEVENLETLVERNRIARNIHDTLGHTLTALGIQLEVVQQIYLTNPEKTGQRLDTAKQLTDQCLQDIRNVVQTLRQSDFDLLQGLTGLMIHLQQTQPVKTKIQLNLPALPLQTSYQIYCIIQEGITNIQKHANASHISLGSNLDAEFLTIELSDNGNGFDPTQSRTGFGLQGMHERLQLIGGVLDIHSTIDVGTHLRVKVPYNRA